MNDYDIAVDNRRLDKSLWISPPDLKRSYGCDADTDEWLEEGPSDTLYLFELVGRSLRPIALLADPAEEDVDTDLKNTFRKLVSEWKDDTWFISSIKKRIAHRAYLQIIGLGRPALPWILEELRQEPDYWSYALEAITREDPVPQAQNLQELRDAWLAWGKAHGY